MRNLILLLLFWPLVAFAASFNDSVLIGGSGPADSKSQLEIKSTSKGVLFPRMTTTQRDAITSPTTSLFIFNTEENEYEYYDGSAWSSIGGGVDPLTANRAVVTDGSGLLSAATTTDTELGYVSGVTSAIQTQFTNKASTTLNNLGTTSINADMLPASANSKSSGSSSLPWASVNSVAFGSYGDTSGLTLNSTTDSTASGSLKLNHNSTSLLLSTAESSTNAGYNIGLSTANIGGSNSNPTGSMSFTTGNKTAGTGDSGGIAFTPGTSAGGQRGRITLADGTEGCAGAVWTSNNNAGGGHWIMPTGDVNYIANPDAEFASAGTGGTPGWATYADTAGTSPVDGTGGSPTVTWTRTTSSPLNCNASFLLTKDASNRQGEGASADFTIAKKHAGKMLQVKFSYLVASGTFVPGTDSTDSDVEIFIYDVTHSTLLKTPLSTYKLYSSTTSPPVPEFSGYFQSASDSTSYRLIVHVASTSASAYTVLFDDIQVTPVNYAVGTIISDWHSWTPTISGFGTVSGVSMYSRRVGDTLEFQGRWQTGTVAASAASFTLGYEGVNGNVTIDFNKIVDASVVGKAERSSGSATTFFDVGLLLQQSSPTLIKFSKQTSTVSHLDSYANGSDIASSSQAMTVFGKVPIVSWTSTNIFSTSSALLQTPAPTTNSTSALTPSSNGIYHQHTGNSITVTSGTWDLAGSCNFENSGSSPTYADVLCAWFSANGNNTSSTPTALSSGTGITILSGGGGSRIQPAGANLNDISAIATRIKCASSCTIYLDTFSNQTTAANARVSVFLAAAKVPDFTVFGIAPDATVAFTAYRSSNQTGVNTNNSAVKIAYDSVTDDSHGAFSTTNNNYVVPAPGRYVFTACSAIASTNVLASLYRMVIRKNTTGAYDGPTYQSVASQAFSPCITTPPMKLVVGDVIDADLFGTGNNSASTLTAIGSAADTYFSGHRVGN